MARGSKFRRAAISLLVSLPLASGGAWPAPAQMPPACPAGYYYASDGYCYPEPQATYSYAPPVYDATPPSYSPPPVADGLAIGLGLGALFGALAASSSHDGGDHDRDRGPPPRRDDRDRGHR